MNKGILIKALVSVGLMSAALTTVYAGYTATMVPVGPSSYTQPSGLNREVGFTYKITNTLKFKLYLTEARINSGSLTNAKVSSTTCSFYASGGTTPLQPQKSCYITLQAPVPTLTGGVTSKTYSNTLSVTDQLGYTTNAAPFSIVAVDKDASRTDTLFEMGEATGYQYCGVSTSGTFSACTPDSALFTEPYSIAINKAGTYAYVGDTTDTGYQIERCSVNSSTNALSSCTSTGTNSSGDSYNFGYPAGVALSPNGKYFYVTNDSDTDSVDVCTVSAADGSLSDCKASGATGFTDAEAMTLNAAGTKAYISDVGDGTIKLCDVSPSTGLISNCASTGDGYSFSGAYGMALAPSGNYLYVTHGSSGVDTCAVNSSTGALSSCTVTSLGSGEVQSIVLNTQGTRAYIGLTDKTMQRCSVDTSTGALSGCAEQSVPSGGSDEISLYSLSYFSRY